MASPVLLEAISQNEGVIGLLFEMASKHHHELTEEPGRSATELDLLNPIELAAVLARTLWVLEAECELHSRPRG